MASAVQQMLLAEAAGGGVPATFDGVASNVTLSNGNLTATSTAGTGTGGARSTALKSTGKFYFEITVTASHGNGDLLGILTSGGTYANMNAGTNCAVISRASGAIFSNNAFFASLGAIPAGTVVCFAFDLGAGLGWIRLGAGNWNGSGTANPATGTGGMTLLSAVTFAPAVSFGQAGGTNGDNMTGDFGPSFVNSAPALFGNWVN